MPPKNRLLYYPFFFTGAGLVLLTDLIVPLGTAVWIGYILLIQLTFLSPHPRFPYAAAALFTGLVAIGLFVAPQAVLPHEVAVVNRVTAVAAIWICAYLILTRRRALDQVTAITESLRLMVNGVKDYAIFMMDRAGNIQTWNTGATRIFGYGANEAIGRPFSFFFRDEDVAKGEPERELAYAAEHGSFDATGWRIRKDSSRFWANGIITALYDDNGGLRGFAKITRDLTDQHEREAELRQALADNQQLRKQLELIVNAAGEGIYGLDLDGRTTFANLAAARMVGREVDEMIGVSQHDMIHHSRPDGSPYPREECPIYRAFAEGIVSSRNDEVFWRKDGASFPVEYVSSPIIKDGRITGAVVVFRDITHRLRAEGQLRASERRLRSFVEATSEVVWRTDANGDYIDGHWAEYTGLKPEEVRGEGFLRVVHPDDREGLRKAWGRAIRSQTSFHAEYRLHRASDGQWRDVAVSGVPVRNERGEVEEWVGVCVDVTEKKRVENELKVSYERLRSSEEKFHRMADSCPTMIWTADSALSCTWVSKRWLEFIGGTFEETLDSGWTDKIHPEDREKTLKIESEAADNHEPFVMEYRVRRRDGEYRWVLEQGLPTFQEDGTFTGYVGSVFDTTDRRVLEQQLRHAQKMEALGQLAGGVAHDFNNLLTVINGFTEVLVAGFPEGDSRRQSLEQIGRAGERAASLTRQLLAFGRQQLLEPELLDLNVIIADTEKMLRRLIGEDIVLTTELAEDLSRVKVDRGQIEQVIMNLAVNARDVMPQGGKLTIETGNVELDSAYLGTHSDVSSGPYVMVAISDNGCGMTPDVKRHLFEPFFTTKDVGKGTGLGLAVVQGIVKQSGGHIEVYSELGKGTTFKIYFPASDEQTATPSYRGPAVPAVGNETLLVVEDEDAVRALSTLALQAFGYTVLEAASGPEALQIAESRSAKIDMLVTDVVMPEMSGTKLAELMCSRVPDLKVLFVSGYTDDAVVRHGILHAEVAFLQKPFTPSVLAKKVREVLDSD